MRCVLILLFIPLSCLVRAQSDTQKREYFDDGQYFFAREDFEEAAYNFKKLVESDPQNAHFNFNLGECYMNIPGKEQLAIPCFQNATKNITDKKKFRDKDMDENRAPLHAWFYLGNVYRINGKLEDALKAYDFFVNSPLYYGNYNLNVVENEIKSCERAKIIMDSPVDASIATIDSINTSASEIHPVASPDGNTIVFIRKLKFYDAVLYVTRQGNSWSQPLNLNPLIGSDGEFYPVSLSHDGNTLYLVKSTTLGKDLYISHRHNNLWDKATPLGKTVNTLADETWACESADGKVLWFASTRKGGLGGSDIYYCLRDKNNSWGKARNAGKAINTAFDEDSPCIAGNDSVLFFSSKGHYSMGGYDIFYSERSRKGWKAPVNIGFPVNNTSDNIGYIPLDKGKSGLYSAINASEPGSSEDIYT